MINENYTFGAADLAQDHKVLGLTRAVMVGVERLRNLFGEQVAEEAENVGTGRTYLLTLQRVLDLLDNKSVIASNWRYQVLRRAAKPALEYLRKLPRGGRQPDCPVERAIRKVVAEKRAEARAVEYRNRLTCELIEAADKGRYVVFDTLTVEPAHYREVFARGANCWRVYLQRIRRKVELRSEMKQKEFYFAAFGVVERGEENGRLHIHAILVMSELPEECSDPMLRSPTGRELEELRYLWPYGISKPLTVWYQDCRWQREGFRWPREKVELKGKKVLQCVQGSVIKIAQYMTKYCLKQYKERREKGNEWRIRMTRNFGRVELKKRVASLPGRQLAVLATVIRARQKLAPTLTKLARREILRRQRAQLLEYTGSAKALCALVTKKETLLERYRRIAKTPTKYKPEIVGELTLTWDPEDVYEARRFFRSVQEDYDRERESRGRPW